MEVRITARHFDLTPELKAYAEEKIYPLSRYFDRIIDSHLVLEVEKRRKKAELMLSVFGQSLVAHAVTDDMYVSIDEVMDKLERQLKKYAERFKKHRGLTEKEKERIAANILPEILEE